MKQFISSQYLFFLFVDAKLDPILTVFVLLLCLML